jgi:hypothetical protein
MSNAQFGALKRAINKQINQKIDTAVDKSVQKNVGEIEAEKQEEHESVSMDDERGRQGIGLGLFGGKVDLKYNDNYDFTSRIYMVTETYDKEDVMKMAFYMYYSANSPSIGIETKSIDANQGESVPVASSMVMDGENKCFLMLTNLNGQKMGMISELPDEDTLEEQDDDMSNKFDPSDFKKSGNTKTIAGYKCEEYVYKNPEDNTTSKLWFSEDVDLKIDSRGWSKAGMPSYYGSEGFEEGFIMAWESYDKKGNLVAKSETKEINKNYKHSVSVKGYTLRQINMK